jgi:mRNA-degrading endonuclease toxin of MazEF toxin-antitoxin module
LADTRGHLKRRPCVILTPTNEIDLQEELAVMAISTSYPEPTPVGYVELPWHNDKRRVPTRLSRRSAAVVNWLRFVHPDEIEEFAGDVPPTTMLEILKHLDRLQP